MCMYTHVYVIITKFPLQNGISTQTQRLKSAIGPRLTPPGLKTIKAFYELLYGAVGLFGYPVTIYD